MLDLCEIRNICNDDTIILTQHSKNRCIERGIAFDDIKNTILNGEIIKQYEDDKPFPSCLVLGLSLKNKFLHVVLSTDIYIITAYYPSLSEWYEGFKVRRK